jgi:hypothetical protein
MSLAVAHTVHLCISYDTYMKQWLFSYQLKLIGLSNGSTLSSVWGSTEYGACSTEICLWHSCAFDSVNTLADTGVRTVIWVSKLYRWHYSAVWTWCPRWWNCPYSNRALWLNFLEWKDANLLKCIRMHAICVPYVLNGWTCQEWEMLMLQLFR